MTWHAIYREDTGHLVSVASVVPAEGDRPAGLTYAPLVDRPASDDLWDPVSRTFAGKRPPPPAAVDPADAILAEVVKTESLTLRQRLAIRAAVITVLEPTREASV